MLPILLTKYDGAFLGPIANILGLIMNGIFNFLDQIGIPNIGLSIILFTIVIYLCMLPLTIRQQKFSKLSAKMNPEIQAVQARYKGKKDSASMQAMNAETQAIYAKYGVSPTGSCVQLLIQMPILFALYRVISNMPAYVVKIKEAFSPLVDKLIAESGSVDFLHGFKNSAQFASKLTDEALAGNTAEYVRDLFIDIINKASSTELLSIADQYPSLAQDVNHSMELLNNYNNFLGINIGNSPSFMVSEAISGGFSIFGLIVALIIPVLSAATQWINIKLMPQQSPPEFKNDQASSMSQSMKVMNNLMPIMSAFFCYSLPAGMGLYWIAGSVVRSIQQVIVNKHIDKIDLDGLIKNNIEKRNKKLLKAGVDPNKINTYAGMNTKMVAAELNKPRMSQEEKEEQARKATEYYNKNAKPGSIAAKADMVRQYNEKNNR